MFPSSISALAANTYKSDFNTKALLILSNFVNLPTVEFKEYCLESKSAFSVIYTFLIVFANELLVNTIKDDGYTAHPLLTFVNSKRLLPDFINSVTL